MQIDAKFDWTDFVGAPVKISKIWDSDSDSENFFQFYDVVTRRSKLFVFVKGRKADEEGWHPARVNFWEPSNEI